MVYGCSETSFTHLGGIPQVHDAQIVRQEVDGPAAIGGRRSQRHGLPAQGLGQPKLPALERDPAARLDPADLIVRAVGQRRQLAG